MDRVKAILVVSNNQFAVAAIWVESKGESVVDVNLMITSEKKI